MTRTLGLIAGSKSLPLLFAREARRDGVRVVAVAFEGETDPSLSALVENIAWIKVGQLGRMIRSLSDRGATECVMLGQIAPKNLFDLRPDLRAMSVLFRLREKNAHSLFGAIAAELARDGITLIEPLHWLKPWMPESGYLSGKPLSAAERADVDFGFRIAQEMARLDIGQLAVVKDGTVLAVEGFEGTDACLERGGKLAGPKGGAVAVKVAKPGHDMRFDIPCLGPATIQTCACAGVSVLAFQPRMTLLIDQPEMETCARKLGVKVAAV